MEKLLAKLPDWMKDLPLLSVGCALVWLLAGFVMQGPYAQLLNESREAHVEAARLAQRDALIEVNAEQMKIVTAVNPTFTNDSLLGFMRRVDSKAKEGSAQSLFDAAATRAATTLNDHPFRTLGLLPADAAPSAFVTHVLIHAGFLHLIASVLLFLVIGPVLEKRWGALPFATAMAAFVGTSGAVHVLAQAAGNRPLVGSSAIVAGLAAALVVQYWHDEIECFGWLAPISSVSFSLAGPVIGALWVAYEASLWMIGQGALPQGADVSIGYAGHAAAVLLGAGVGFAMTKTKASKQEASKAAGAKARTRPRFDIDKAVALRNAGSCDEAYALLEAEVRESARDRNVVMTYWELAIQLQDTKNASGVLLQHIEEELRRGAVAVVAKVWKSLHDTEPDVLLDAPKLIRLAPAISKEFGEYEVAAALWQALSEKNTGLTPTLAASVARMAVEVDIRLATEAAQTALRGKDLDESTRAEMKLLRKALAPGAVVIEKPKAKVEPAGNAFFEEQDRSGFGEASDLSEMLDECFPDGAISEAQPTGINGRGIKVKIGAREEELIEFTRIHAVAIVGVHGMADKPIVLIDFVIDGKGGIQPLTLLRLRCDRFDPRTLIPKAETSKQAMRILIQGIRKKGLNVLADITAPSPDGKPVFESESAYHDKLIRPVSAQFA